MPLVLPVLGLLLYSSAGRDDAYITYWAADSLKRTGRISNINGGRLEQSTSLLHTAVLAAASWITTIDVPRLGYALAIVFGALSTVAAYALGRRLDPAAGAPAAIIVATLGPLVYWSFGGLETSLAAFLLLASMLSVARLLRAREVDRRDLLLAFMATAGVVLVRPDCGLALGIACGVAASILSIRRRSRHDVTRAVTAFLGVAFAAFAMIGAVTVARLIYFGEPMPHPVLTKQGSHALSRYLHAFAHPLVSTAYIRTTFLQSGAFVAGIIALVAVARRARASNPMVTLTACTATVGMTIVGLSGGDWMEAGRLLAPWLALVGVLAGVGVASLQKAVWVAIGTIVVVIANLAGNLDYVRTTSTGTPLWERVGPVHGPWDEVRNSTHRRDLLFIPHAEEVTRALIAASPRPRIASGQAGMVVYYLASELRHEGLPFEFVDLYGLTTSQLAHCGNGARPTSRGRLVSVPFWVTHTKTCGPPPDAVIGSGDAPAFDNALAGVPRYYHTIFDLQAKPGAEFIAVSTDLVEPVVARLRSQGWHCAPAGPCRPPD